MNRVVRILTWAIVWVACVIQATAQDGSAGDADGGDVAAAGPSWTWDAGLDIPSQQPGKLDLFLRHASGADQSNLIWWSPGLKGGIGVLGRDGGRSTRYGGAFLRPLRADSGRGELVVGLQAVDGPAEDAWEIQGEYRFSGGLGFGFGRLERDRGGADVTFAKATYRHRTGSVGSIAEVQAQEVAGRSSPGAYLALFRDDVMVVAGHDGEQWRATLGYVAAPTGRPLRPAVEVLFVDSSVGEEMGSRFLFVNATLGYQGGFLSHPARLGRAMGPQGLEFGNPLGFVRPTWNRRLDPWELGGIADFRLVRTSLPGGTTTEVWEALAYPLQLAGREGAVAGLFAGASYSTGAGPDAPGALIGYSGGLGFLRLSAALAYDLERDTATVAIGVVDRF